MRTEHIPREEWLTFFDTISRKQEGVGVALEVLGPEIGDQIEERNMYLAGFTAELGDQLDRPDEIGIMLGGGRGRHLTHRIVAPIEVNVQKTELGIDTAIQIKSADGTASIVHLT